MNTQTTQIDVRACATAVVAALKDLQGYLSAAANPDRMALDDLAMEPMGWTKRLYSKRAFEIWQKQHELFPDDPLILHHMAILHHARAFDLEATSKPSESDADWAAAIGYWSRLQGMDAFWDKLTAKACAGTVRQDVIKKLREEFPQRILAIHYDIALDKETREKRKSRAKFHVAMVHKAPFSAHDRAEAQRAAYNRYIQAVPDEVWQPNELRENVLAEGQKAIVEYLDFDPGCVPALEDALRLQRRVQRSRNTKWRAMSPDDPQRQALLLLEKKDADAWRPFFDQLVSLADQLEDDVREDLSGWYAGRGHDLCALDRHEQAVTFFEQAVAACRPDSDGRRNAVRHLVQTMALVAREKAGRGEADARACCDKVWQRKDLTAIACYVLAQAYLSLSMFDVANQICVSGMKIEPDFDDLEADEWAGRLTELQQQIPRLKLMHTADEAMKAGKYEDAVQALNKLEALAKAAGKTKEYKSIYWLRTQCHLASHRFPDAERDARTFAGLAETEEDRQHAQRLREVIAQAQEATAISGLLDKAKEAMEAGRFRDALPLLDEAARRSPRTDVIFFLRAQAHMAVGNVAGAERDAQTVADLAETDADRQHAQRLKEMIVQAQTAAAIRGLLDKAKEAMEAGRFSAALPPLNEAGKKAPRNPVVYFLRAQAHMGLGNVADARRDARKFADLAEGDEDRKAARRLEEMIAEGESAAAVGSLLSQAQSALQNREFSRALRLLDDAAGKAPDAGVIYFLRAQAHMASGDMLGAMNDARKFEPLARTSEERDAAKRLKQALFGEFG
jgi:tetratricopeptide (TPR) repeat protein